MFTRSIRFVGTLLIVGLCMVGAQPASAQSTTADVVYGQLGSFTTNTQNNGGVSANSLDLPEVIALDSSGNLYVTDTSNSRVLFYPSGSTTATRVYGQLGSFTTNGPNDGGISANSLDEPVGVALDSSGNLYVVDNQNNRVLFYPSGSTTASRVYGQGGSFTTNTQNNGGISADSLLEPVGVALDSNGNLYVTDGINNRVLFYPSGSTTATRVYGQDGSFTSNTANNGGISANSLDSPTGIVLDSSGNLYVADQANNRVLFYPSGSTTATRIYGQLGSFTSNTANNGGISANSLDYPAGIALDSSGNLYVPDIYNNRVLFYSSGNTTATRVYGQLGSFTTNTANNGGVNANSLGNPDATALDSSGNLYVVDYGNSRVLMYPPTTTPGIYDPANLSTLTGNSVTFWWAGYPGATAYWLDVGKEPGGNEYYQSGSLSASTFSQTVNSLPSDGSTVYATWWYLVGGSWSSTEYQYTAFGASSQKGAITVPVPSTTLMGSSVTFTWTAGNGATAYWLDVGSSAGGNQYYQSGNLGNVLTTTVSGLPTDGSTVYVTLYSLVGGQWLSNSYTYTAFNASLAQGVLTTPIPGSTLIGSTITFDWTAGIGASAYWLDVGSTPGGNQYFQSGNLGNVLTVTVNGLPTNGSTVYVTLYSFAGAQWLSTGYTYTAYNINAPSPLSFLPAVNYFAGGGPNRVAVGDFNGDGKPDLVVTDFGGSTVSVLLGRGDGTFQAAASYGAGSAPTCVAVGDFNGDGKLDLAVANYNSNNVSVLLGNGDGTFQVAMNYRAGINPRSVAVGDFNGEGKLDLAVANHGSGNVSVLLGNGDGTFQAAVNYSVPGLLGQLAVRDLNGDGKLDLAVANGANNVSVLLGNGDGTFEAAVSYGAGNSPISVAVGDFNGDGEPDLAVPNFGSSNVSVLLGKGDGTFQAAVDYGVGSDPDTGAVGDFNGDGKLDFAVPNDGSNNVSVLLGNGDGTFQAAVNVGAGSVPQAAVMADLNGDGKPDLAVANQGSNDVSILLNTTAFLEPASVESPEPNSTLAGTSVTFQWDACDLASAYWIDVGLTPGGNQYYQSQSLPTTTFSAKVSGLPTNGSTIYVTMHSLIGGQWFNNQYTYTSGP